MVEYGNAVGQGTQIAGGAGGHPAGGAPMGDVGSTLGSNLNGMLNSASAALGVSPTVLIAAALILLVLVLYLRFAR